MRPAAVIAVYEPTRRRAERCWLWRAGWRSRSPAAQRLVRAAWAAFDWPGWMPGRVPAFVETLPGGRVIHVDPRLDRIPPGSVA